MFPRDFFLDYWDPALRNELFGAIPFSSHFDSIWEGAIAPAALACGLKAHKVNQRKTSDSIHVDILDGIAHSRLVFVDVSPVYYPPVTSTLALFNKLSRKPQYPNGNVMYELGIAHATRQAEEVIVVRNCADTDLLFDVIGIRTNYYPPNDLKAAQIIFEDLMRDALTTIDRTKALLVAKAMRAITLFDKMLIRKFWPQVFNLSTKDPDKLSGIGGVEEEAISNLQKLGILHSNPLIPNTGFSIHFFWTEFGNAVVKALGPSIFEGRTDPRLNTATGK